MTNDDLFEIIEEQILVNFTGKIIVVHTSTKQMLGSILFYEGELINTLFQGKEGAKAFYNLFISNFSEKNMSYVIEPEIINLSEKKIHYPLAILKRKLLVLVEEYQKSSLKKPPENLRILVNPAFLELGDEVNDQEYSLLCTLSDYNKVEEVYKNCNLLDFEITNAFVSLREKRALKVVKAGVV